MDVWEAWELHGAKSLMKLDSYADAYQRHFSRFQGAPVTMLEIGVLGGGSLQMWRTYFGPQSRIIGVDIDPACLDHAEDGIEIYIGDQADRGFLESLVEDVGTIDIVLDDGGHTAEQQITSFDVLFDAVAPTGVYACEDVHSSYLPSFGPGRGGAPHPGSFIEHAKTRMDEMHAWFSDGAEPTGFARSTASMHLYTSLVVFEKAPRKEPEVLASIEGRRYAMPVSQVTSLWTPQGEDG